MKLPATLLILVMITGCGDHSPSIPPGDLKPSDHLPDPVVQARQERAPEMLDDSVFFYRHDLKDTLYEDLNCDGLTDRAFFTEEGAVRRLVLVDGKSGKSAVLGIDLKKKGSPGADYRWVDFWGITKDSATNETIVKAGEVEGSRKVSLQCPSILVRREEEGGGIISFRKGGYVWVHQAD